MATITVVIYDYKIFTKSTAGDLHRRQECGGRQLGDRRDGGKQTGQDETGGTAENEGEKWNLPEQQKFRKPGSGKFYGRSSAESTTLPSNQVSISPTFYEQLFLRKSFRQKFQTQILST
jgi:hypothetical protein